MGSAVKEYNDSGGLWGQPLPEGLGNGSRLEKPMLTATTKVDSGGHDEPISVQLIKNKIGRHFNEVEKASLKLFNEASLLLENQGILLLDTKFEFALYEDQVMLIDEILTPDSSRFCFIDKYNEAMKENKPIQTMDKQIIRTICRKVIGTLNTLLHNSLKKS